MTDRRAATRYAEAVFGLARERGTVEAVREELEGLVELVEATPALQELLARPDVQAERKLEALGPALGGRLTEMVMSLLAALVRHRRGEYVAAVTEAFGEMADDAAGVVRAEAQTAVPLSGEQRARLVAALSRMTGRRVALEEQVNPAVLAGVRVRVGERLVDGSAAGRLERLREELIRGRGSKR